MASVLSSVLSNVGARSGSLLKNSRTIAQRRRKRLLYDEPSAVYEHSRVGLWPAIRVFQRAPGALRETSASRRTLGSGPQQYAQACAAALALMAVLSACSTGHATTGRAPIHLLNVSYDPTRELYQEIQQSLRRRLEDRRPARTSKSNSRTAAPASRRAR